jgi:hypothetical protein
MTEGRLANFLIVGSTKAGTTSVYHCLQQHPQIYLHPTIKESNFFIEPKHVLGAGPRFFGDQSFGQTESAYMSLFENSNPQIHRAIGEVCTTYLHFSENAIPRIKHYLGDPKIIIFLRNPIERAYSHYMHNVRDGDEAYDFSEALRLEDVRKAQNLWLSFRLKELGKYSRDVENYLHNFTAVKVIFYEDMRADMQSTLDEVCEFLEVDRLKFDVSRRFNQSGVPKSKAMHSFAHGTSHLGRVFLGCLRRLIGEKRTSRFGAMIDSFNLKTEEMCAQDRAMLEAYYYDEINRLSMLLGVDLRDRWKMPNEEASRVTDDLY